MKSPVREYVITKELKKHFISLFTRIAGASTSERVNLNKLVFALQEKAAEIIQYEEKIHHFADQMIRIDMDDGVKDNYAIFQDVLAKIK